MLAMTFAVAVMVKLWPVVESMVLKSASLVVITKEEVGSVVLGLVKPAVMLN